MGGYGYGLGLGYAGYGYGYHGVPFGSSTGLDPITQGLDASTQGLVGYGHYYGHHPASVRLMPMPTMVILDTDMVFMVLDMPDMDTTQFMPEFPSDPAPVLIPSPRVLMPPPRDTLATMAMDIMATSDKKFY